MRVPLSWLADYVDLDDSVEQLGETLTFGGFEVEAVHRPSAAVRGVVIAQVDAVEPVADSDKLHVATVSDGTDTEQVVAGAANFAAGDRVAWVRPGGQLPAGDGEVMEVGRRTLFGHTSNGMLASPRELGIGDDHARIWVLDADAPLGADLGDWLGLDETVLELAVLPDRGYGLSMFGLARDLAALTGAPLHLPEIAAGPDEATGVPVSIADPTRCARFDARRIEGVEHRPSPSWVQQRLAAAGMRPISAIVDATNYAMLETGHPVHAYDLDRLAGPRIDVRDAGAGETLVTIDDVERALDPDDLVIADADGPVALAGVMGGQRTEVNADSATLLLEVASFDPAAVLRATRRHKLFSQASTRFEKTVPAATVPDGAGRAAELITRLAGGKVVGVDDHHPAPAPATVIRLDPARSRSWLGMDLVDGQQRALLESIGCTVGGDGEHLSVTPPAYRPDLQGEADLFEELARLHGYAHVPERLPSTGQVGQRTPEHAARRAVRAVLAGGGWTEVVVFPFLAAEDMARLDLPADDPRLAPLTLANPLSAEESALRTSLLPGLLRTVRYNTNRRSLDVAVFEVGHVFWRPTDDEPGAEGGPGGLRLPAEPLLLGLAAAGAFEPARHDRDARPADLYDLLGAVRLATDVLGHAPAEATPTDEAPYHPGRAARLSVEGVDVGVVGELHPRVCTAFELPARTLAGELRLDRLVAGGARAPQVSAPSPLPSLHFDVAVVVDEAVPAARVEAAVRAGAGERLADCRLFDVFRGEQIGQDRKSLAYALRLDDHEQQLTDADEAAAIDGVARSVAEQVGGALRR